MAYFPKWLRRVDPMLSAEDTNAAYNAFLARRMDHHRVFRLDVLYDVPKIIMYSLGLIFFFMIFFGKSVLGLQPGKSVLPFVLVYSSWIFSFLIILVQFFLRGKRRNYLVLPVRISGVFRTLDYLEQQSLDLWLAGTRGYDIAQALYLETWERLYGIFRIVAPIIVFAIFFYLARDLQNRGLADFYFYPVAALLVAELLAAALIVFSFIAYGIIDFRHDCWLKYIHYRKFMLRNIIGGLFGFILILLFAFMMMYFRNVRLVVMGLFNTDEISDITINLLVVNAVLFVALIYARRLIARRLAKRLLQMDSLFTVLMRHALMNDPDAMAPIAVFPSVSSPHLTNLPSDENTLRQ